MYLYLFDFIPDHFLSVSRVCTSRNYLLTGDFGPDGCMKQKKGNLQQSVGAIYLESGPLNNFEGDFWVKVLLGCEEEEDVCEWGLGSSFAASGY